MTGQIKKRIADCAEVLPGLSLKARAEHEPEGTHQVIMAKHLKEGVPYIYDDKEDKLRIQLDKKSDRYRVYPGDILFIARGSRNEAIRVKEIPENTVASSTLYIIRAKESLDSGFLIWILEQSEIKAKIAQARTGAGTPFIQRTELMDVSIPIPDIETQKRISLLNDLMSKERLLLNQVIDQTKSLHQSIGMRLFKEIYRG